MTSACYVSTQCVWLLRMSMTFVTIQQNGVANFYFNRGQILFVLGSVVNVIPDTEMFILLQAYQHLGEVNIPKFTVIIAQKNHHTRFFLPGASENVPPGWFLKLV